MLLPAAQAAEWALDPKLSGRVRYDDNLRIQAREPLATTEVAVRPELAFARASDTSEIKGIAAVDARRFDQSYLNTTDQLFDIKSFLKAERSKWGLDANFTKDTTLDSELDQTGVVSYERIERISRSLAPNLTFDAGERTQLTAGYNYLTRDYAGDSLKTGFYDFTYQSANAGVVFNPTQTTQLTATLNGSRYDGKDQNYTSDTAQLQLGIGHAFTERTQGFFSVGPRVTKTYLRRPIQICPGEIINDPLAFLLFGTNCFDPVTLKPLAYQTIEQKDVSTLKGVNFMANLRYQFEAGSLGFTASRDVNPSGRYGVILTDRAGLTGDWKKTELLTFSLGVDWYTSVDTATGGDLLDRNFLQIKPSFTWRFLRDWTLVGNYRYRQQRYRYYDQDARSNSVMLYIVYGWPKTVVGH